MERIGFIGLGIMGKPMAGNLIKAGYPLAVFDRRKEVLEELSKQGAEAAASARQVAEKSSVVISIVPDSPDVEDVVFGSGGVLEGIKAGTLYIDMSTIAPSTSKKVFVAMQARGVEALDAPVSGGEVGAKAASLSIMVGGGKEAFQRALPIFQVMGKNIVHMGEPGAGQVTKACNQIVVGVTIQAVAEALTLAAKAGVDPAKVREALLGGFAQSRILELHGKRMLDRTFQPGFKIKLHRKDLAIALQTGRELEIPLFTTGQVAEMMDGLLGMGRGDLDHSALALLTEKLSGMEKDK
jgi:2-hydroxy-3-oxopropionate reductase